MRLTARGRAMASVYDSHNLIDTRDFNHGGPLIDAQDPAVVAELRRIGITADKQTEVIRALVEHDYLAPIVGRPGLYRLTIPDRS